MPKIFLASEGEVAKPTAAGEGARGSTDPLKDDVFRDQRTAQDRIKTARKVSVAPMMDWTDNPEISGGTRSYEGQKGW